FINHLPTISQHVMHGIPMFIVHYSLLAFPFPCVFRSRHCGIDLVTMSLCSTKMSGLRPLIPDIMDCPLRQRTPPDYISPTHPQHFIVHCSLFIVHCSLFIVHCSLFIVHCSLFIVHCSLFIVHCSLFIVHCSL